MVPSGSVMREVRAHAAGDRHARGGEAGAAQRATKGSSIAAGSTRDGVDTGGRDARVTLMPLPPASSRADGGPLHLAGLERPLERDRAVERRVRGERDDHASHTSTSASSSAAESAASGRASVTSTSISSSGRSDERLAPSLSASASTTTRRASATIARLTAASLGSGVREPKLGAQTPFVPMNAMSGRMSASWATAVGPTAALVMPRTVPPMMRTTRLGLPCSRAAIGTEFV